jgi:stringent starvation protein B
MARVRSTISSSESSQSLCNLYSEQDTILTQYARETGSGGRLVPNKRIKQMTTNERRKQNLDKRCDENQDSILTDNANATTKWAQSRIQDARHAARLFTDEQMR